MTIARSPIFGRDVPDAAWRPSADRTGTFRMAYVDVDKTTPTDEFTVAG